MASSFLSSLKAKILSDAPKPGGKTLGKPAAGAQSPAGRLDAERLTAIFGRHKKWLESGGKQGARAVLRDAVLSRSRGRIANISLRRADLRGCMMRGMHLDNVVLAEADLRDADLRGANLATAQGLTGEQMAGADLSGARLAASAQHFPALEWVPEHSRRARAILIATVLASLYALLTVATTTDAALFLNGPSSPLPLLFIMIPLPWFYALAPVVLFGLFATLHLYLVRLWGRLARLPAVFPDGSTLDQSLPSWLFHGVPFAYFPRLREKRPNLFHLQHGLTLFLAWGLVPLTQLALWFRYLVRHDGLGGILHVVLLVATLAVGLYAFALMGAILRGDVDMTDPRALKHPTMLRRFSLMHVTVSAVFLLIVGIYSVKATGAFGLAPLHVPDLSYTDLSGRDLRGNDLSGADLSRSQLTSVDLRGADLTGADLSESVLTRAQLSLAILDDARILDSRLDDADLRQASLRRARLDGSNLSGALLSKADMTRALIRKADLRRAALDSSILAAADLTGSNLTGANASFAQAQESRLTEATAMQADLRTIDLTAADLTRARLTGSNLEKAKMLQFNGVQAKLSEANMQGADLKFANLEGADLRGALLIKADVRGANLKDVTLSKADLSGANLTETNIDCVKIAFAKSDRDTQLPDHCKR